MEAPLVARRANKGQIQKRRLLLFFFLFGRLECIKTNATAKGWQMFNLAVQYLLSEAVVLEQSRCSVKIAFLESSQNSEENTCAKVLQAFLWILWIFKNILFHRAPLVAATIFYRNSFLLLYCFFWMHFFKLSRTFKTFLLWMWTYFVLRA